MVSQTKAIYLLQQRDEEVDGLGDVLVKLLLVHVNVSDGNTEGEHLLHLELDGALDLVDLSLEILLVGHSRWELAGLVETWTNDTRDLLDESGGSKEGVVGLCKFLHELLVLLKLLEGLIVHARDVGSLGLIAMTFVTEKADFHAWASDSRETDGSCETLVLGGIVVLEDALKLNGLGEVTLFKASERPRVTDKYRTFLALACSRTALIASSYVSREILL